MTPPSRSEVVRGTDLLRSTFRQLLLYRALTLMPPDFYHLPLVTASLGNRLAKRDDTLSLRTFRTQGVTPTELRARYCRRLPLGGAGVGCR